MSLGVGGDFLVKFDTILVTGAALGAFLLLAVFGVMGTTIRLPLNAERVVLFITGLP